jgi:hypothetical protein
LIIKYYPEIAGILSIIGFIVIIYALEHQNKLIKQDNKFWKSSYESVLGENSDLRAQLAPLLECRSDEVLTMPVALMQIRAFDIGQAVALARIERKMGEWLQRNNKVTISKFAVEDTSEVMWRMRMESKLIKVEQKMNKLTK